MAFIPTKHVDGDVAVVRNASMGGKLSVAGNATFGHNVTVKGWLEAVNIKATNKGVFQTLELLNKAYPNPQDGWFAGVGTSAPFTAYIGQDGVWTATGGTIDVSLDTSQYTEDVAQLQDDIANVKTGVEENASGITELREAVTAEATARQEADAALQAAVDAAEAAVTAEAEARDAADKALSSTVDATCQAIVADVEALQTAVATETQGRKSADTSLDSRLTAVEAQVKTNTENIDSDLAQVQARIGDVERQVGEVVKTVELTQLDNMVLSRDDAYAMTKETAHSVWTVTNDGRKVGVLQVFADGSSHQLTQVLTSNYTASDDWSEHWDGEVRTYYRMYNIQSPSLENAKGTWSSWTELVPKTCRTYIETLKSFMEETPKQVALTQDEYDAMAAAGTLKDGTYYNILEE